MQWPDAGALLVRLVAGTPAASGHELAACQKTGLKPQELRQPAPVRGSVSMKGWAARSNTFQEPARWLGCRLGHSSRGWAGAVDAPVTSTCNQVSFGAGDGAGCATVVSLRPWELPEDASCKFG